MPHLSVLLALTLLHCWLCGADGRIRLKPRPATTTLTVHHATSNTRPLYPHVLMRLGQSCARTQDCTPPNSKRPWCSSGRTCVRGECHLIPNYPCPYFQTCDEKSRSCVPRACRQDGDCDDRIFCNGFEQCVNRTCTSDFSHDCTGGQCDETRHRCYMPPALQQQRARLSQALWLNGTAHYDQLRATALDRNALVVGFAAPTEAPTGPTAPTAAPTASTWSNDATIAVIVAAVVLVIVVFIFLMLALVR